MLFRESTFIIYVFQFVYRLPRLVTDHLGFTRLLAIPLKGLDCPSDTTSTVGGSCGEVARVDGAAPDGGGAGGGWAAGASRPPSLASRRGPSPPSSRDWARRLPGGRTCPNRGWNWGRGTSRAACSPPSKGSRSMSRHLASFPGPEGPDWTMAGWH